MNKIPCQTLLPRAGAVGEVATSSSQPFAKKPQAIIEAASEIPSLLGGNENEAIRIFIGLSPDIIKL